MSAGIVLVHGFSGSPNDLMPLALKMTEIYGDDAVATPCLPGHGAGKTPSFDQTAFMTTIANAINRNRHEDRTSIVLGHSTGGILALATLAEYSITPDLLILASTPKRIDPAYLERWNRRRSTTSEIPFIATAQMVSCINSVGSHRITGSFPVLILHGSDDELVPSREASQWEQSGFYGTVRSVVIPSAGHNPFKGANSALAVDIVLRAVADTINKVEQKDEQILAALSSIEPETSRFFAHSLSSRRHISHCPSGLSAAERPISLQPMVDTEPVFANIEITTRCNLRCIYCARTLAGSNGTDMDRDMFTGILDLLPHAYRITLVGLGETLLHPQIVDFVADASSRGRRTALVTNAMLLEPALSRELLKAGLESIAFSVDGSNQKIASEVRPGTDLERVIKNIKGFVDVSRSLRPISTAVFSAVSITTVPYLEELLDLIAGLDVHVLMLTDLNFTKNAEKTLWKNVDERIVAIVRSAVSKAFKNNLPVLSVRGLEEFGLWKRYAKFLLLPPDQLYRRSTQRAWCFSTWQTVPISVRGEVTLCDCQPDASIGNILNQPLADIWNGPLMVEHRSRMLGPDPPEACKACPRF